MIMKSKTPKSFCENIYRVRPVVWASFDQDFKNYRLIQEALRKSCPSGRKKFKNNFMYQIFHRPCPNLHLERTAFFFLTILTTIFLLMCLMISTRYSIKIKLMSQFSGKNLTGHQATLQSASSYLVKLHEDLEELPCFCPYIARLLGI